MGDSDGDYGTAPTVSAKKKTNLKKNDCKSNSDCSSSQKCVGGKCVSVCTDGTCLGETPDCSGENHKAVCSCTENSCGSGKKCSDGKCVSCSVGDKCGCSGEQVIVSGGKCGCPASATCPAGQYKTDDCSCRYCLKDNTYDRCGCTAPLVPNGSGGCYCKETTCAAGNSFSSSACGCVPCTDNESCQYPCPNGQVPNGSGGCDTQNRTCKQINSSYFVPTDMNGNFIYTGDVGSDGKCAVWCGGETPFIYGSNFQINHSWCLSCPPSIGCEYSSVNSTHKCCKKCKPGYTLMGSNGTCVANSSSSSSGSSSSSSCEKCSPSSAGTYRAGSRVCFFGSSFAKNAWNSSGGCCSNVSCTTVAAGHYCQVGSDGILVGGTCPSG